MNEDATGRSEFNPILHYILYHSYAISSICVGGVKPAILQQYVVHTVPEHCISVRTIDLEATVETRPNVSKAHWDHPCVKCECTTSMGKYDLINVICYIWYNLYSYQAEM